MGLRFRRSIKLAPGIRVNLTKTGLGLTFGSRGAHYSVHSSGRRTTSVGLPGSGVYYQSVARGSSDRGSRGRTSIGRTADARAAAPSRVVQEVIPHPGIFASSAEKAYHAGVLAHLAGDAATAFASFREAANDDPTLTSANVFAGFAAHALGDATSAIAHLDVAVRSHNPMPDKYEEKYLVNVGVTLSLTVGITHSITASVPMSVLGAALGLAELYQVAGRLTEAIGLVQQIHTEILHPIVQLSLCDLLFADKDYAGVVETSTGVSNDSDVELETLHLRAAAFDALGDGTAAMDAYRAALAKTVDRDPRILTAIRYDRGLAYQRLGQQARAKADLERVYAADPSFEDVKQCLDALSATASA